MKNIMLILMLSAVLTVSADEEFKTFLKDLEKLSKDVPTNVELIAEAGSRWTEAEKKLYLALDGKLQKTKNTAERLKILQKFHTLSREIQKTLDIPEDRARQGSLGRMHIYNRIAQLMEHQTAVLNLAGADEKRWKRLADTSVVIGKRTIKLQDGRGEFKDVIYDRKCVLEIILFPRDTFTWKNRDFAVVTTDAPFSVNSDFANTYLCELQKGKLIVRAKSRFSLINRWERQGDRLVFFNDNEKQEIKLK